MEEEGEEDNEEFAKGESARTTGWLQGDVISWSERNSGTRETLCCKLLATRGEDRVYTIIITPRRVSALSALRYAQRLCCVATVMYMTPDATRTQRTADQVVQDFSREVKQALNKKPEEGS